jgi:predicted KAP-like P-loop ATPase
VERPRRRTEAAEGEPVRSDRPINAASEDRLHRASFARQIAAGLVADPTIESVVVAIVGSLGCGKSSLLRLVRDEVAARGDLVCVVDFNPWLYSGDLELAAHLLGTIGDGVHAVLKDRDADLARKLVATFEGAVRVARFGGRLVAKAVAQRAGAPSDLIAVILPEDEVTAKDVQTRLTEQLADLPFHVFVFIDEVDWFPTDEVRELARVLRVVADLPRTTYVLAFDRRRVELVLGGEDPTRGRAYLEKIVDQTYEVPPPSDADLWEMLLAGTQQALVEARVAPRGARSTEVTARLQAAVLPFVKSPRDVGRYVRSLPSAIGLYGKEVHLADALALAAVRVFAPDAFSLWLNSPETRDALMKPPKSPGDADACRTHIREFWGADPSHVEPLLGLTQATFPVAWQLMGDDAPG